MAVLVDSSVFIALERRAQPWQDVFSLSESKPLELAAITASELLAGVFRSAAGRRRLERQTRVQEILNTLVVRPFDLEIVTRHAQVWAELIAMGQVIGLHDLIIAATALTTESEVLTENVREFSRVPGLEVRQPRW